MKKVENLLNYAIEAQAYLDSLSEKNFASEFVRLRIEAFNKYHWFKYLNKKGEEITDYVIIISLGLDYFKTIIKYWNNPKQFLKDNKDESIKNLDLIMQIKMNRDSYNENFVRVLEINKHRQYV